MICMDNWLYNTLYYILRPVFRLAYGRRVRGMENIPSVGGFVLCSNHMSVLDPLFIASALPRTKRLYYLGKKELFENRLLNWAIPKLGGIPVDRGHADLAAIRTSLQVVKEGYGLCIFPQGTRSRDNTRTPMLTGASMIALRCNVPVVPVYIDGPYRLFRRTEIRFGKPLDLSVFGRRCDQEVLNQATAMIDDAVWAMKDI